MLGGTVSSFPGPYARRVRSSVLLGVLLLAACSSGSPTPRLPATPAGGFDPAVTVTFEGAPPITAEVARRPDQRARGLMQRTELPEGTGMLFLFPGPTRTGFWMKGTLIPLSIAYVDRGTVVSTTEMTPCRTATCPTYPPDGLYTAAVEAPAGFFPKHGVRPGTRMTVTGATAAPE